METEEKLRDGTGHSKHLRQAPGAGEFRQLPVLRNAVSSERIRKATSM